MKKTGGYALLITGFLACPCHLVITLPLALALLGGTALGAFLFENQALVFGVASVYFLGALVTGFRLMSARSRAGADVCSECGPEVPETLGQADPRRQGPSAMVAGGRSPQ